MSGSRKSLVALRRMFTEDEWAELTQSATFNAMADDLHSDDDILRAARFGLELVEQAEKGRSSGRTPPGSGKCE